jgi:hypothetical protein
MKLGFCGPSASGKSTLSLHVVDNYPVRRITDIARKSPGRQFGQINKQCGRMNQWVILSTLGFWAERDGIVMDRTPLDAHAYSLITEVYETREEELFAEQMVSSAMESYDAVFFVPREQWNVYEGDDARINDPEWHQRHSDLIWQWLFEHQSVNSYYIPNGDVSSRTKFIDEVLSRLL